MSKPSITPASVQLQSQKAVPRFCKDCKFYDNGNAKTGQRCLKIIKHTDLLSGELVFEWARFARNIEGPCGPDGLFYESSWIKQFSDVVMSGRKPKVAPLVYKSKPELNDVSS